MTDANKHRRALPYDAYNEAWFRVLNDLKPGQPLPAKQRIKVVAG